MQLQQASFGKASISPDTWDLCKRGCTRTSISIRSWKHCWSYKESQVDTWQSCHSKAIGIEWWSLTSVGSAGLNSDFQEGVSSKSITNPEMYKVGRLH
jgi:hypothetical protein